jgi:acyl dehydratase
MEQSVLGLFYEDFVVGEVIDHALSKTIFESDNNFFSLLTISSSGAYQFGLCYS